MMNHYLKHLHLRVVFFNLGVQKSENDMQISTSPSLEPSVPIVKPRSNKKTTGIPLAGLLEEIKPVFPNQKDSPVESDTLELPPQLPSKSTKPASRSGFRSVRGSTTSIPEQRISPSISDHRQNINLIPEVTEKDDPSKLTVQPPILKPRKHTESKPAGSQFDLSELKSRQQKHQEGPARVSVAKPNTESVQPVMKPIVKDSRKVGEQDVENSSPKANEKSSPERSEPPVPQRPVRPGSSNQLGETTEVKPTRPARPGAHFDVSELKQRQEKAEESGESAIGNQKPGLHKSDSSPTRVLDPSQSELQEQLRNQLIRQFSNHANTDEPNPVLVPLGARPKKTEQQDVPALPSKLNKPILEHTGSQKAIPVDNAQIPPWKQELERRKQQQTP
jgi:hypothetical protein